MKRSLLVLTAFLMFTSIAAAGTGVKVRLDGGVGLPVSPESFTDAFEMGVALGGSVTGPVTDMINWRGSVEYASLPCNEDLCGDFTLDMNLTSFSGGIEIGMETGNIEWSLFGEAGLHNIGFSEGEDSENRFGFGAGLDIDAGLGESWGINGQIKLNSVTPADDADRMWWASPTAGVFFRF